MSSSDGLERSTRSTISKRKAAELKQGKLPLAPEPKAKKAKIGRAMPVTTATAHSPLDPGDVTWDRKNGMVLFWAGWPSQWYKSEFKEGDTTFNCTEQYMMYHKAKAFNDETSMRRIMESANPRKQKALGRKVEGFSEEEWDRVCDAIVERGNILKFSQDERLRRELEATKGLTLVEASPKDARWGIGMAVGDARSRDPSAWPEGSNRLGKALMRVRDELLGEGEAAQ